MLKYGTFCRECCKNLNIRAMTHAKIFGGFDKVYKGQSKVIIDPKKIKILPPKMITFPKMVNIYPQLVNISPIYIFILKNTLIYKCAFY